MDILAHTKMWVLKVDKQCPGQACKGQLLAVPSTWELCSPLGAQKVSIPLPPPHVRLISKHA